MTKEKTPIIKFPDDIWPLIIVGGMAAILLLSAMQVIDPITTWYINYESQN